MTNNNVLEIPEIEFDTNGELIITASSTSSEHDFDFYEGKWKLHNRKLKTRLNSCTEWSEFESTQDMHRVLNGMGNIDNYLATFNGEPFEGMSVRLFNPKTKLWAIYWADNSECVLQPPVIGSFKKDIGHFFAKDSFSGIPIIAIFRWDASNKDHPVWSQAFSKDSGKTWEWNWYMYFSKFE